MTDQWNDRLSEYLDDELTPGERAALESHLATCRDCAVTLDDLVELADAGFNPHGRFLYFAPDEVEPIRASR